MWWFANIGVYWLGPLPFGYRCTIKFCLLPLDWVLSVRPLPDSLFPLPLPLAPLPPPLPAETFPGWSTVNGVNGPDCCGVSVVRSGGTCVTVCVGFLTRGGWSDRGRGTAGGGGLEGEREGFGGVQ